MNINEMPQKVGQEIGVSDWMTVDQFRIGVFAECTEDRQWIHTDPERAEKESPFGAPVAHGFLSLSLLVHFQDQAKALPKDASAVVNYGLEGVRFLNPVKAGARIRNRVALKAVDQKSDDAWRIKLANTVEIEDEDKPALVAESILLVIS